MKTNTMTGRLTAVSVAALSLAALVGGSAMAQQAAMSQTPARHAPADADGDGRVSQAEFVQGRISRLTALDANHDGTVSVEERRAAHQARRGERIEARFERLDADKNGQVSRAEFDAARPANRERPHGEIAAHLGPGQFGRWSDHGGQRHGRGPGRGPAERVARGPILIADVQSRLTDTFGKLDANHDGYVTPQERRAAMQGLREQRRENWRNRTSASPSAPASQ